MLQVLIYLWQPDVVESFTKVGHVGQEFQEAAETHTQIHTFDRRTIGKSVTVPPMAHFTAEQSRTECSEVVESPPVVTCKTAVKNFRKRPSTHALVWLVIPK